MSSSETFQQDLKDTVCIYRDLDMSFLPSCHFWDRRQLQKCDRTKLAMLQPCMIFVNLFLKPNATKRYFNYFLKVCPSIPCHSQPIMYIIALYIDVSVVIKRLFTKHKK